METSLPQFINTIADSIKAQCKHQEHLLTNCSVRLRKLYRNLNDSDRYGWFSPVSGNWQDVDASQLYTTNIVTKTIRTNTSAMQTANVKIDIAPRIQKDTQGEMAAQVARVLLEQKDRLQWTDFLEQSIAMEQQLGPGVFIKTFYDKTQKRQHKVPQWETQDYEDDGILVCTVCEAQSTFNGEVPEIPVCPNCGGMAEVEQMPTTHEIEIPTGFEEFSTGDTATKLYPFFEFRIDDLNTQGGNIKEAKWFEHHYYQSVDELQLQYPDSKDAIKSQISDVSYPLKWQRALKRNYASPSVVQTDSVIDETEVRDIYLTPSMYLNHKFIEDFELKNTKGEERFSVKAGKTLGEAKYEGKECDCPPVICVRLINTTIIDIFVSDFREEFQYVSFLSNPSAFWGLFLYDIVSLQDIITHVLSIQVYHIRRNAITRLVYNRNSFDPEEFDKDRIPTKQTLPPDIPISSQFGVVPALTMNGEPMQMFMTMLETLSSVALTTPAMEGQAQPNEPYAAQALQKQSSLGLLAPAERSKAQAKVGWAKQQLKLIQEYWTEEDTEEMLNLNPDWTEDFIMAFVKCELDRDLNINYKQGTEIPQSLIEREIKLQNMLNQLMALGGVADGTLAPPDAIKTVLNELFQSSGLDIDVGDSESNLRLAQSRFDKLTQMLQGMPPTEDVQQMQLVAQEILQLPIFQPLKVEDYKSIADFYADKQRNEAAKDNPNWMLITCLQGMIMQEQQAAMMADQEAMAQQMEAAQPMMDAQAQQQEQAMAMEQEAQAQSQASNNEAAQLQALGDERQREHDMTVQERELMDNAAEREARLEQARLQNQRAAKTGSKK